MTLNFESGAHRRPKLLVAGEEKVVGVAGITGSGGSWLSPARRQSSRKAGEICQGGGGGCSLGQMVTSVESSFGGGDSRIGYFEWW